MTGFLLAPFDQRVQDLRIGQQVWLFVVCKNHLVPVFKLELVADVRIIIIRVAEIVLAAGDGLVVAKPSR